MRTNLEAKDQITRLLREDWGRMLAALVASLGDYALAEDSLQDAVVSALDTWPQTGLPQTPAAWMIAVARRKAIDRLRRQETISKKEGELMLWLEAEQQEAPESALEEARPVPDQRLELMFTCCHPALDQKSRVALTLRALGGLATAEIASSFLDKPEAMAARLTRAKKKIKAANIGFKLPEPEDIGQRLDGVLQVIYLIFNEGAHASNGDLIRVDLGSEAIRLGRILAGLMPQHGGAKGLLALMLLSDSRRFARISAKGEFVPLELQNRARWDRPQIVEGLALVEEALAQGPVHPYAVEAAISALHAQAPSFAETDWPQIVALYDVLQARQDVMHAHRDLPQERRPNPILAVNQALALSYARSPEEGLAVLDSVSAHPKLAAYQPYHSCRADLLARVGRFGEAAQSYRRAIELSASPALARYLSAQLDALESP